jgi:hypothetical protein
MGRAWVFLWRFGVIAALGFLATGCERSEPVTFHSTDISGVEWPGISGYDTVSTHHSNCYFCGLHHQ